MSLCVGVLRSRMPRSVRKASHNNLRDGPQQTSKPLSLSLFDTDTLPYSIAPQFSTEIRGILRLNPDQGTGRGKREVLPGSPSCPHLRRFPSYSYPGAVRRLSEPITVTLIMTVATTIQYHNQSSIGTNAEPSTIGGSICAERAAMCKLREAKDCKRVTKVVVVTDNPGPLAPGKLWPYRNRGCFP